MRSWICLLLLIWCMGCGGKTDSEKGKYQVYQYYGGGVNVWETNDNPNHHTSNGFIRFTNIKSGKKMMVSGSLVIVENNE